jgi:hypothetical protein
LRLNIGQNTNKSKSILRLSTRNDNVRDGRNLHQNLAARAHQLLQILHNYSEGVFNHFVGNLCVNSLTSLNQLGLYVKSGHKREIFKGQSCSGVVSW